MKTLFIDDVRQPPPNFTRIARTFNEAAVLLEENWDMISFDHDLGEENIAHNGLSLMNILEERVYQGKVKIPVIHIHTDNGGARGIMELAKRSIYKMKSSIKQETHYERP